jgi:surface antigen
VLSSIAQCSGSTTTSKKGTTTSKKGTTTSKKSTVRSLQTIAQCSGGIAQCSGALRILKKEEFRIITGSEEPFKTFVSQSG